MEEIIDDVILNIDDGKTITIKNVPIIVLDDGEEVTDVLTSVALSILVDMIKLEELPNTVDYAKLIKEEELIDLLRESEIF